MHTIFSVIANNKKGYSKHPETLRFRERLGELVDRHSQQVAEMIRRGYMHKSPLPVMVQPKSYIFTKAEFQRDMKDLTQRGGLLAQTELESKKQMKSQPKKYCKCGAELDSNGNCPYDEQLTDSI